MYTINYQVHSAAYQTGDYRIHFINKALIQQSISLIIKTIFQKMDLQMKATIFPSLIFLIFPGLHDVMSYLGVYKLPVGVYHVTQRPGAFDVTSAACLYTPFSDMFPYGLPRSFSIVASIKCPNDSNGYLFTICDSNGDLQLGLEVGQNDTAFSVTFRVKSGLSDEASVLTFSYSASASAWKQFGISVHDDVLELHYDCDKIYSVDYRGLFGKQGKTNLMMSIGKYVSSDNVLFEGALEQLVISENVLAAEEQCTTALRDSVSNALKLDH